MKRICSLYVSKWHLITMLLPYVNSNLEKEIVTILEENLEKNIAKLLDSINLREQTKNAIKNIDWNKSCFEEKLDTLMETKKDIYIIVDGSKDYVEKVNHLINFWENNNRQYLGNITVVNCYEITGFSDMQQILKCHDKVLNTSGERDIAEVFRVG